MYKVCMARKAAFQTAQRTMSMAEYMCKLFYGRRGIQLNEEQISLLFPNRNSNYFGLSFPTSSSKPLNHFPPSNFEAGDEACHLQQDKASREACSLTDHSNYPPSTYRFTHNSTLPTVYSSFHMPPLNIPTTSSCNTDFHSPYFSYLQTTAYPYYKNTCSRGTGLETSLQHKFFSQSPSEACKEGHKDEVNAKRLEVDLAPPPLEGGYSDALLGDSGAAKMPAVSLNRWNSCNQDSFFFKPLQHHDDHQWNNCTFQTRDSQLLDLEKPSELSGGVKRESCIYLPCPSNLSFGDCVSGDKMTNVDGLVTTLDLNINCNACKHPQLSLLQKPSLINYLPTDYHTDYPTDYPPVFNSNAYQLGHYPPLSKDFHPRSQCLMNNRIEVSCKLKSLQHMCAVCGDHAACQHYGVRTCEGCKGFFKRTVQKGAVYVCLSGKNCPIDKRRRNRCQYCRFEKCLSVGMVKEVVRTDLLKGRRGRLPSKPKLIFPSREASISPPTSFITSLVRAYVDTAPDLQSMDYSHYNGPFLTPALETHITDSVFSNLLCRLLEASIRVSVEWSSCLPGFDSLCHHDQQQLFHASLLEMIVFRLSFKYDHQDNSVTFCNGVKLHCRHYTTQGSFCWLNDVIDFSKSLKDCQVDLSTFSCLLALCMITQRAGLKQVDRVDSLQSMILEALRTHHQNQALNASFLPTTLAKLTELKSCSSRVLKALTQACHNSSGNNSMLERLVYFSSINN